MQIVTLEKNEFDTLAENNKYESYFQTSNYAELQLENGFDVHYLGFTDDNDTLIGGAMCLYKKILGKYSYAYVPRGLLIDYDNPYLVNKITTKLKKLLYKQNFIFIKIDPPIIVSERDKDGKILYSSNTVKNILSTLNANNYNHLGFNLYNETKLPRWNLIIKLNKDIKTMYNSFDENIKENLKKAQQNAIFLKEDNIGDIETFHEFIKKSYGKINKKYLESLYKIFSKDNKIDILYTILNTQQFVTNANNLYNMEEEKNRSLANIISGNDSYKYDIQKVISDKMISDKNLHTYKKDIVASTEFLKKYPDGKILATSLVIKHTKGIDCLLFHEDPDFSSYNGGHLLIYEMLKKYANLNYKYLNIGPATGNFDKRNPYYQKIVNKLGFNTTIMEYIGEFDLIINPLMYKIYQYKQNKEKKKQNKK